MLPPLRFCTPNAASAPLAFYADTLVDAMFDAFSPDAIIFTYYLCRVSRYAAVMFTYYFFMMH